MIECELSLVMPLGPAIRDEAADPLWEMTSAEHENATPMKQRNGQNDVLSM